MKREFLAEDCRTLHVWLQDNSLSSKLYKYRDKNSYMYEFDSYSFVLEEYKSGLNKLILISNIDLDLDDEIKKLEEITDNKLYSKEYLELFGNPKSYDFDELTIFKKCKDTGLDRLDLHFKMGMSSAKVLRVVLYRLHVLFNLNLELYKKEKIEYDSLEDIHTRLKKALKYAKDFFDKKSIKSLLLEVEDLYLLIKDSDTYEKYTLNFDTFLHEKDFYNKKNSTEPIYFFDKKESLFELVS